MSDDRSEAFLEPAPPASVPVGAIIDACAFHEWPSAHALGPHFSPAWREVLIRPHDHGGPVAFKTSNLYRNPLGDKLAAAYPASGPAASDRMLIAEHLLAGGARERVVLGYDEGLLATSFINYYVATVVCAAANDWTAEEWLARDRRLYGLILVTSALPTEAAAEIRRSGRNDRFVGVAIGANGLNRPFGHPIYHPIYEACHEMGLPLVIQVGSDSAADQVTPPVAGGLPATYGEYRALSSSSQMSHLVSMLIQGVFERYPGLKLMLVGGGAAWLPGWLWRLDYMYKTGESEAPWMKRLPSEYFSRHVRVSTGSLEAPADPARLAKALATFPGFDDLLVYTSCYPNEDCESPAAIAARLPDSWHPKVFRGNALDFFRWPASGSGATVASGGAAAMTGAPAGAPRED